MKWIRWMLPVVAGLGLIGCSWNSAPPAPEVKPREVSPVVQFMAANAPGATGVTEDAEFGGEVRITVEDEFISAAGETCKRATLFSPQHEAEIIIICRDRDAGESSDPAAWVMMPRVWGKGI